MQMGNAQDAFLKKMRIKNSTLFFSITNKCNSHCRHCINIGGKTVLGEAEPAQVLEWIEQVAKTSYRTINFVGGEPFLFLDDLQKYCAKAQEVGLLVAVTTNGFWARTEAEAERILKSLPGLKSLLVSTDRYHLEFVQQEVIHNLLKACLKANIFVAVNATCASREEGEEIKKIYEQYQNRVFLNVSPIMPAGAGSELELETFAYFAQQELLPDFCGVRDHFVNYLGGVDACCMATLGLKTRFLYLGSMREKPLSTILQERDQNPLYRFIAEYGPRGLARLLENSPYAEELQQKRYTSDCHFCVDVLNHPERMDYIMQQIAKTGGTER